MELHHLISRPESADKVLLLSSISPSFEIPDSRRVEIKLNDILDWNNTPIYPQQKQEIEYIVYKSTPEEIELHENKEDLTILRDEFERVVIAARKEGFYIYRISAENSQNEVVALAEKMLKERICKIS